MCIFRCRFHIWSPFFFGWIRKTSIIRKETKIFWFIGGFRYRLTKMDNGFRFCRSKNLWITSYQFGKLLVSQTFWEYNSECHAITVTGKRLKTSKMKVFPSFFIQGSVFIVQNSNPMSIFIGRERKTSIIVIKKTFYPDYREYQIRRQDFLETGWDGTRSAPSALHFVPRCLQSAISRRPKLRFGPEILINSTLSVARCNNTLELMSNCTAVVDFLLILLTLNFRNNGIFSY